MAEAGIPRRTPLHGRVITGLLTFDDRDMSPGGSAAEWRRGSIDDRGIAPVGSAAEWRGGSIDDRCMPPGGSDAEWRRGSIDGPDRPPEPEARTPRSP